MKHLQFFYLTLSYSIGLVSLTVLILAYLKSWWNVIKYLIYFLLTGTAQLIFLTFMVYRYVNIPIWFNTYFVVINYGLECLTIFIFPLLINELFNIARRRQINYAFGILSLGGLICIITPVWLAILNDGIQIETLISFRIYRCIFIGAYLYSFTMFGLKIKNISDTKERNFYIFSIVVLLILFSQIILPVIKPFPENILVFATGYFYINVLLLKYMVNRFFIFSKPSIQRSLDDLITNREKEILILLAQGMSNKDIGGKLCITETTVKSHVQNIYKKLGVSNRVQLLNSLKSYLS